MTGMTREGWPSRLPSAAPFDTRVRLMETVAAEDLTDVARLRGKRVVRAKREERH